MWLFRNIRDWPGSRSRQTCGLIVLPAATCVIACTLAGCGGGVPAPVPATPSTPTADTDEPHQNDETVASTAGAAGTKWLGTVPYDVFYDRPLDKVGVAPELGAPISTAVAAAPAATSVATPNAMAANASPDETSASGSTAGVVWSSLISADLLDAESKVIRSRLANNLQSVSTYNRSIDAITNDAIIMAALGGVAERFDTDMRWKDRAAAVRTLAYEVYENVGAKGRKAFTETQVPFEKMVAILDGGPTDGVDAEPNAPMADFADRSSLMTRIDRSFDWLKGSIASEGAMMSNQDETIREASVLAMIGGMIKLESYEYHEEKEYQRFCDDFANGSKAAAEAAAEGNFQKFQDALGVVQNSCGTCHGQYQFNDDGL